MIDIDPVKWLDDLWVSLRFGRGVELTWPADGPSGMAVEKMLRNYGVRVLARRYSVGDSYGATVKAKQAVWAEYLLGEFLAGRAMPKAWGAPVGPTGLLGRIADLLSA